MSLDLLPEVLLALGAILVPGGGACLATRVAVGRTFVTFLALTFGLGFAIVSILSLLLALVDALGPATLGVGWLAVTAVVCAVAVRRGGLGAHAHGWRRNVAADPWAAIGVGVTVIGVIVVRWTVDPLVNLSPTVLRYWADGLEIADAGGIPETTLQWGRVLPPAGSKVALSAFDAAGALLLGRGPIEPLAALLFVVALGLVVATIAVFTELGIRRWAPVAALILFFTRSDLATDLNRNLAEDWGRMVAIAAVLAGTLAVRAEGREGEGNEREGPGRRVWPLAIAGGLLGIAAGTHLVAACVGLAILCSLAVATGVIERGEAWRRALGRAGAIVAVAVAVGMSLLVAAPGDLGFQGAVDQDAYAEIRYAFDLPETFDPTLFISINDAGPSVEAPPLGFRDVAEHFASGVVGVNPFGASAQRGSADWLLLGPTIVALALVLLLVLRGPPDLRVVAIMSVILALGLLAVGVLFAFRYDVFALEYFGNRRLFSYATIPFVAIAVAAAEAATRWLGRKRVGERGASILACICVLLTAAVLLPLHRIPVSIPDRAAALALIERIGREVPCEGRVLATHRTLGSFQTIAGHAGVLEGMGPHVRPAVLRLAVDEILQARAFFADPSSGREYLRARGVDAIVVARRAPPFGFGGYRVARVSSDQLDGVPFLRRSFENDAGVVYRVVDVGPRPDLPIVAGRPGFDCRS